MTRQQVASGGHRSPLHANPTVEIVGAAIFIGLSAVISAFLTPVLPRVPGWGIAILDPISAVWITCFLVFGYRSGFLCLGGGTLVLFMFDPTGIGPIFKFFATLPFIAVPTLMFLLKKRRSVDTHGPVQQWISKPVRYGASMGIAFGARILIMLACNYIVFSTLWAPFLNFVSLEWMGLPQVTTWTALTIGVILINSWQSVFDIVAPYLLTFKIVDKYL